MPLPPFDPSGFLPPGRHQTTPAEMKVSLVVTFINSIRRPAIFERWERHLASLRSLIPVPHQWIGGSFVSAKVEPDDIDVCSFIDGPTADALPEPQQDLIRFMTSGKVAQQHWTVDSYAIVAYPPGSPHHAKYQQSLQYWSSWWGSARPDSQGVSQPRGFLEVQ